MIEQALLPPPIVIAAEVFRNILPVVLSLLENLFQELTSLNKQAPGLQVRRDQGSANPSRQRSSDSQHKTKESKPVPL
ncbi:MAG: hypothetical protein QM278_11980 [Pseudomonadota bacterium]|nr:hypothetical protein [Pseudomonadota bacterium]